jgi:divalent metal cation (Fe/Co/Zn/Cd) transporter
LLAWLTGLQYHVELPLEVDPQMTVQDSHELARRTRFLIREQLDWIADVVVHIEPFRGPVVQKIIPGYE